MKRIERVASVGGKSVKTRGTARLVLTGMMVAVLAACGGGGGDGGTPVLGPGSGTDTGGGATTPTAPTMSLKLTSTTVTAGAPVTVTASVRTATGAPVAGSVVSFATPGGLGKFDAASALTNENGDASVTLSPASATATGADSVTATATVNGTSLTASGGFQLAASNVTIDSLTSDLTLAALPPNTETTLTVGLSASAVGTPVTVSLSSTCAAASRGTLTPTGTVSTSTGVATFRFRDNSCGSFQNTDTFLATISGAASTRSLVLNLGKPAAQSIQTSNATNQTIYLKGSGYTEFANVTFKLVDNSGNGVPNQPIDLSANVWSGGLTLDDKTNQTITKNTDINGDVVVRVNSGTIPTPVRVTATLKGTSISTVSSALSIAVGLPSQINFSLSQGTINIDGMNRDGTLNTYSIIASDRMGNPVPDGTAINFVTEAGQVLSNVFTVKDGNGIARATANFASAEPRPSDGRVTVLAYALGEESFIDKNGDNVYTDSADAAIKEQFQDLGSVFLDRQYNNFYNSTDQFIKQNDTGGAESCNPAVALTEPATSLFRLTSYTPSMPNTASGCQGRAYVRRAVETVYSTSNAAISWGLKVPNLLAADSLAKCPSTVNKTDFGSFPLGGPIDGVNFFYGYSSEATPRKNTVGIRMIDGDNTLYSGIIPGSNPVTANATLPINFLVSDANPEAFNPMPALSTVTAVGSDGLTVTVVGGGRVPSTPTPSGAAIEVKFADATSSGTVYITVTTPAPGSNATTFAQKVAKGAVPGTLVSCP